MAKLPTYIQRRNNRYYAVLNIPAPLQKHYPGTSKGKHLHKLVQSLETENLSEAKRRVVPVVSAWKQQFAELRDEPNDDASYFRRRLQRAKTDTRSFVSHSAKATNKYQDRWSLAYLLNKFLDVDVANYFKANNLEAREELFALSELVQWIFRSRIRNGQPIELYIPSARMRNLLKLWLAHSDRDIIYERVLEKGTEKTLWKEAA